MKVASTLFAAAALALSLSAHAAFDADAANKALKDNGCTKCHSVDKAKKGPAFQKVAAEMKAKANAEAELGKFLSTGPKVKIDGNEEEHKVFKGDAASLKNVVQFILGQ